MKAQELPGKERKTLQYVTIITVALLVYLLFIRQDPILAMLIGAALLIAQRVYLKRRGRKK